MNSNPLISIIVPVYKAEKYIRRCVDSLLAQTFLDFEVLLIDDGSPDNSAKICDKYALTDTRVKVFHQKNKGVSAARNLGLTNANGQLSTFVDADDYVDVDYLEKLLKGDDLSDMVISGFKSEDELNELFKVGLQYDNAILTQNSYNQDAVWDKILRYGFCTEKMYKTELIKDNDIQFNDKLQLHEDHLFFFQCIEKAERIRTTDAIAYNYVNHGLPSLSRNSKICPDKKFLAYESLSKSLSLIVRRFHLDSRKLILTNHFIISMYVASLVYSYANAGICTSQKIKHRMTKLIRTNYKPTSVKGKLLKFFLLYFPQNILSLVCKKFVL